MSDQPTTHEATFDPYLDSDLPAWPKVIGIISCVWAGLGLCCAGCGFAMPTIMTYILKGQPGVGDLPPTLKFGPLQYGMFAFGIALAILLGVAGALTISRTPKGRVLHLVYGVLGVISALVGTYIQMRVLAEMNSWVVDHPDSPFAKQHSPTGSTIGTVFGIVIGCAWPVFCLIWFGLVKRKPGDITRGVQEQVA